MTIKNAFDSFKVSFEVFPPKTDQGTENLFTELKLLQKYNPEFISVTYGAGGSTRDKTIDIAVRIKNELSLNPLTHFTCVGNSREEVSTHLERVKELGLTDILALRGDPPAGSLNFTPPADGFRYASELISFIKKRGGFGIAAAGYPQKHPDADSLENDILHLREKEEAGAELILTQLFLLNDDFFRFRDLSRKNGIKVRIIPGIMPVVSLQQIEKITQLSGMPLPGKMNDKITKSANDPEAVFEIGIEHAVNQVLSLKAEGSEGIHLYPLNKSAAVSAVIDRSGILS